VSEYEELLAKAKKFHGDVCPGIVLGTRVAMVGRRELGMSATEKNRDLIVYVEIDRCMADAIQAITGCSLGHRSLKAMNYGKFAATFVDTARGNAVRVSVKERTGPRPGKGDRKDMVKTLAETPEADLIRIQKVRVAIPDQDMPGFPKYKAVCSQCGDQVLDGRESMVGGKPVCKACAQGAYYEEV